MSNKNNTKINIMSFGYKYGFPREVNFLQDVRFLPNPYYDEKLKEKTGLEPDVREYVKKTSESREYISKLKAYLELYISQALSAEKENITIAIGCTGGRHRSVTVACEIYDYLASLGYCVSISHRDINKDK